MNIVINELSIEQINTALLRITRAIQSNTNNFQNDVEKAVANVTITGKTTIQKYDDSRLMAIVNELNQKYNNLSDEQASIRNKIVSLETILANVALDYDPETNELTYSLGDYSNSVTLRDTTYTFSYDDETGAFTIVDDFTGETVFSETFNDTTYTFSFDNGILTVHNNLLDTDQTFNFDARYYTESEIQSLILDKIPSEASSSNQLADKEFVNSSIATSTATFRGTVTTTQALAALTGDANDYAYLQNIDPTTGQTISYDRYKWVESGGDYGHWKYEYTLNNSSFTAEQWEAINSGITCQIVQDLIDGCYSCESNIDVYCDSTCKCTINNTTPLCLCANAFNANATISTTDYPGACCTGTLVQSDLNDYQKKNIPTAITINNTSNLTCIDTIFSCFNSTIQKSAKRKSWTSAHCRYIYLANIAVSSGSVSSSSYTLYLFSTIYDSCPTKSYSIGTIQIDLSSGSNANGFNIRGYTDVKLDCTTANYPRIVVTKDTTNNIYRLYLDTNYAYLSFDIQRNKGFGSYAWGDFSACASLSGTEIFNSSTSPDEIKYIGGLVSISDKAAANENTPILLCTGETSVGKSSSCSLTFNTCNGVLSANRFAVIGRGDATFAAQNLTASDIGLTAGCCYPLTCILESLMACKGYQAGTYIFAYSNAQNPIICETGGYAYCAVFTKEDAYNPVTYTWNMTRWRVTFNNGRSYCASAYSTANAGIACWNVYGSTAVRICRNAVSDDGSCYLALFGGNNNASGACIYVSNGCSATFNPATGALSAECFIGAIDETKYPGACCTGTVTGGSFNGTSGTVNNGCLSFSNINFDNICNSPSKNVAANNITRRYLLTNQITSVGYITRWGLGLERGTTGWGTGLLSLGIKDDGTCFADYKFTQGGNISLTCCGTEKGITLSGCATKNVFTCCLASASATTRYFQIKTKANRGSHSVSFDFDFFSMNGTINLDNGNNGQYYAGGYYGNLCVSVCSYTCACCDCFWLTYSGYRTLTLKSVYDFEVICNTTTAPEGVTFCCFVRRPGSVTKIDVSDDAPYDILLSNVANNAAMPSIGSNSKLTFNPSTGILNVSCGTCIGWYRTKSCCVKVTPTAQSSCWIYVGRFQTNGTGDTTNTYNDLNITIAAVGNGMVSSANIKVLSANATSPTVIVQRQAGYSSSTGIDCVAVTRSGSVWNCHVCIWARVKSNGTNAYYVHLYRNMLPDTWGTALTVCSAITGDVVGVGNAGINSRAIQSNADLRIGNLTACTSTVAGCGGSIFGSGYMELFATTPFIDFHVNNSGADCSSRIIASTGSLGFNVNNATGCTASTESAGYTMCSNGLLYSNKGFVAGCVNAACPFLSIDCGNGGRMVSMTKAPNSDVGLLLSHCADWTGTTYCNLGIELGSGNVNRGFYHCKAGTFEWLQFWDATCERHACPQCFACPIYGCSSATFAGSISSAGSVSSCNTERWGTVYSSNTYSTGYYLIAQFNTAAAGSASHDITIGGKVDAHAGTIACRTWRFKAFMRGNKCTVSCASVYVDSDEAANWLCFTRSVDTATCAFTLRVYARIGGCWSRYNTTIDYLAGNDVAARYGLNCGCLTFPNTYAADSTAFVGTLISPKCSCGILTADGYKTNSVYRCCSFPANSKSYVLLGCFNITNDTNLDLGFSVGGSGIVGKGNIKALLTNGSCCLNCFCNNNIEVKYSNYINDLRGVSSIGFTTSGSSWDCRIGVWLEICNCSSSACCWSVSLFRNLISDAWSTCMTCQSTMPTFVCAIQVPACRRNFYYNNADAMINTWAYDGRYDSGSCKCMVFTFQICGVGELRAPTHQKIFLSTTGTGVSTPLNMWIEYMKGTCKDYIAACYAGGASEVIVPMRISSDHDNSIYIDYAVCCDVARQFCTHIYDSGNMPAGAQGNSAIINDLCGCWLYDAAGGYNLERNTQVVFNVDCPDSQYVTNVITAQTIAACCVATTSDIRQKKDIKPYNNGLSLVKNLDIISFRYLGESQNDIEHISIPANWSCQLISGKGQNQLRVNDAVGILLSAVKDLGHSMTLWQRIRLWFYKRFVEVKTNKVLEKKVKNFTNK